MFLQSFGVTKACSIPIRVFIIINIDQFRFNGVGEYCIIIIAYILFTLTLIT